jgi:hypothetical protein
MYSFLYDFWNEFDDQVKVTSIIVQYVHIAALVMCCNQRPKLQTVQELQTGEGQASRAQERSSELPIKTLNS